MLYFISVSCNLFKVKANLARLWLLFFFVHFHCIVSSHKNYNKHKTSFRLSLVKLKLYSKILTCFLASQNDSAFYIACVLALLPVQERRINESSQTKPVQLDFDVFEK